MKKNRWLIVLVFFLAVCTLSFSSDYREVVNNGIILFQQGMFEESLKVFESAVNMQTSLPSAYYYLGEVYYNLGNLTKALENYNRAVELQGSNPDYHYSIALLYLSEGKIEESLTELNKVIEIAPLSITGKYALRLKESISADKGNKDMFQKWLRIEEERRKQLELEQQQKQSTEQTPEGMPMEPGGIMPGGEQKKEEEVVKIPVEQVIKRIRFGTKTLRLNSSLSLCAYDQAELIKVCPDIIDLVHFIKEPPVRKNLITALGKAGTPEAITTILGIIQDKNELYDIKIVCVESINKIKTQEVAVVLRTVLKSMVDKRESERAEAKKKIDEITTRLDTLAARKIKLNMDINHEEQKKSEIDQKLQFTDIPPEFMMMPPGTAAPGAQKPLTEKEIMKLREDSRKIEESIKKMREEIVKIDYESADLEKQKSRYVALLQAKEKKITDINMPVGMQMGVVPPEGIFPGMEPQQGTYQETDEDKNEVVFALQVMRTLGEIRDKEALSVIKKGWDEYGVEKERNYHLLTLARLGDFSGINDLVTKLKEDYTQDIAEEIRLRTGIIEVIGDYLAKRSDNQLQGLIEFLSEEGAYPEIRGAAESVLTAITKSVPEKKKSE